MNRKCNTTPAALIMEAYLKDTFFIGTQRKEWRGEESKQDLYCRDKSRSILLGEYLDGNLLISIHSLHFALLRVVPPHFHPSPPDKGWGWRRLRRSNLHNNNNLSAEA